MDCCRWAARVPTPEYRHDLVLLYPSQPGRAFRIAKERAHLMRAAGARIVLVTAADERQARSIARMLVDERLAACVNVVGPIRSIYRWRDAVEDEVEYLLLIKTRAALLSRLERRVIDLHSYEVPEVLALAPAGGSAAYLGWLLESTVPAPQRAAAARRPPARKAARRG